MRRAGALTLTLLGAVACGGGVDVTVGDDDASAVAPWCDELEPLEARPGDDADPPPTTAEPQDDVPTDAQGLRQTDADPTAWVGDLREWGETEAADSFAGFWRDPALDTHVVAFTEDVDQYAEQVHERFHSGFAIAEAEHTYAELEQAARELFTDMEAQIDPDPERDPSGAREPGDDPAREPGDDPEPDPGFIYSSGLREDFNRLSVGIHEPDRSQLAELSERFGADLLCFETGEPPQPLGG